GLVESALFDVTAQISGERLAMLQHAAIQIGDIERAFGAVVEVHRAESLVRGGEELPLIIRFLAGHRAVGAGDEFALDEVAGRFADEGIAIELGREQCAAINAWRARGGKFLQPAVVAQNLGAVATIDAGIDPDGPDKLVSVDLHVHAPAWREAGISSGV